MKLKINATIPSIRQDGIKIQDIHVEATFEGEAQQVQAEMEKFQSAILTQATQAAKTN
jgi:hypothetical protein